MKPSIIAAAAALPFLLLLQSALSGGPPGLVLALSFDLGAPRLEAALPGMETRPANIEKEGMFGFASLLAALPAD